MNPVLFPVRLSEMCVYVVEDELPCTPRLRTPPADERYPHQLPVALAGALVDSDYAHLPGTCTGPYGESGDGAVIGVRYYCPGKLEKQSTSQV